MTGKEWMDRHGLKVGDKVRSRDTDDIFERYRGLESKIISASDSSSLLLVRVTDERFKGLELSAQPSDVDVPIMLQPGIPIDCGSDEPESKPKPEYADSPFPTLAEFLS